MRPRKLEGYTGYKYLSRKVRAIRQSQKNGWDDLKRYGAPDFHYSRGAGIAEISLRIITISIQA
jgi:hypothetical protein